MKGRKGLLVAAVVVTVVLVSFIYFTTDIFDGLLNRYQPPAYSASLTSQVSNRTVTVNATVTGGVAPFAFIWDFGDGTSRLTSEAGVTYTYAAAGTYTVTVIVRDSADNLIEARAIVTVA